MMGNSQDEEEATAGLSLLCVANNGRARDNEEEERTTPVVGSVSGSGSGLVGAVFNFTNAIIGAGAMGLGGAIAQSGGLISLLCLTCFAALAKLSCDMVVELKLHLLQRLQTQNQEHEHEQETLLQLHSQSQQEQGMWLEQHTTKKDYAPEETESSSSSSSSSSHGNTSTDNNNMRQNHRNININNSNSNSITVVTYERIGFEAFGLVGQLAVSLSKGLFSFGCLVAYVIVIQDNFANGLEGAIYGNGSTTTTTSTIGDTDTNEDHHDDYSLFRTYLHCHEVWVTLVLCTVVILPMCLGRDISYLAKASFVSILAVTGIVGIVIYLYVCGDNHAVSEYVNMNASSSSISSTASTSSNDFHTHWLEIRGGLLESLGTFVFAFVPHHTIDMTFDSLQPRTLKTYQKWQIITTTSIALAYVLSTTLGMVVYMTFWQDTQSDLFGMYPPSIQIDVAKLCLSISMLMTFALPFFACREIAVMVMVLMYQTRRQRQVEALPTSLTDALLPSERDTLQLLSSRQPPWLMSSNDDGGSDNNSTSTSTTSSSSPQLTTPYHVGVTIALWAITIATALAAPNLGDVLDLVGSVSGSMIAFVLPGLFSLKLLGSEGEGEGCSLSYSSCKSNPKGVLMSICGIAICVVGTFFSSAQLVKDVMR